MSIFKHVNIALTPNEENSKLHKTLNTAGSIPLSLEQIILYQIDEPKQKSCIYKLEKDATFTSLPSSNIQNADNGTKEKKSMKYVQIRVKSLEFNE